MVTLDAASGLSAPFIDPLPFVRRKGDERHLELLVRGMHCAACISRIERAMHALPGVLSARVNLSTGKLALTWKGDALEPRRIVSAIEALGFDASPFDPETMERDKGAETNFLLRCLGVTAFASMNVMLLSVSVWADMAGEMGEGTRLILLWISALIAIPATLYGGLPFYRSALGALRVGRANMDVPISIAVLGALLISVVETALGGEHAYFEAPVMLLFLLLVGRVLDHRLREQARAAAKDLLAMQSGTALRLAGDGSAAPVQVTAIAPGDELLILPGDRIPVNAVLIEGESSLDRSLVTGESMPIEAKAGELLYAGVRNLTGRLRVRAIAAVGDSLVAELTRLIEAGEQRRSAYIRWADRAAEIYVPVVHTIAALTLIGWLTFGDATLRESVMAAIAVLIITYPCALGLAVPAVQVVATGRLFQAGILVKSGDALERIATCDTIVFDKTGTLTYGRPRLTDEKSLPPGTLEDAALLARTSRHPLSRAIAEAAGPGAIASESSEIAGKGVEARVNGEIWRLGSALFTGAQDAEDDEALSLWFRKGERAPVRLTLHDALRTDAAQTVEALTKMGFTCVMLSGDREAPARRIAEALGFKEWESGITPEGKTEKLKALRSEGRRAVMVGDGMNDAPALAEAEAGISFGNAAGISQSAADLIIEGERLLPIVEAINVSRASRTHAFENFAFSALYNALAIPLAVAGLVTPLIAAIAMSSSSLVVTLNALRLAKGRATT
ncbi:MAG: cadmium-translocating P-type ATPase [Alphaproteobacteria bacterium]|nr:cadmium-translocating P-type ATPase [Alphaproteobacteria bacterium]